MVGALVYMLKGKDLISDKIPVIGIVDDLAVLGLALQLNSKELEAYKTWREKDEVTRTVEPIKKAED